MPSNLQLVVLRTLVALQLLICINHVLHGYLCHTKYNLHHTASTYLQEDSPAITIHNVWIVKVALAGSVQVRLDGRTRQKVSRRTSQGVQRERVTVA